MRMIGQVSVARYGAVGAMALMVAVMGLVLPLGGGGGGGGSTTTLPADNITLADENNYYTSDNVEGALKQLYELAAENGSLVVTTTDQTANRAIDGTPYQNGDNLRICVVGFTGDAGVVEGYIEASSPPTIMVAHDAFYITGAIQLIVPPNYFYAVWGEYGGQGLNYWYEMEISGGGGGTGGDYTADIENLRDVLDNQIIRIDNLIDVCDNYGGDLDNYRGQIDNLRAVADNLKTRVDNCQTHVDNLRTNVDNVRTVVDNLRGAADNLKTRVDNYQTHIDNLRAICDNFKSENTRIWTAITGDNTAIWAAINGLSGGENEYVVVATENTVNSTTTLKDATGLSFSADANSTYIIEGYIVWNSNATANGIKLSARGPTSPTVMAGLYTTDSAAGGGTPVSSSFNADNVAVATLTSSFTAGNLAALHCVLVTTNAGTFAVNFAMEAASSTTTIMPGSTLRYRKVA